MNQVGRLAMRQEGGYWNAYYAMPDSMGDSLLLGSISMAAVSGNEARRLAFMGMMRDAVSDLIEGATGVRPIWGGPTSAPEHEKAGNA